MNHHTYKKSLAIKLSFLAHLLALAAVLYLGSSIHAASFSWDGTGSGGSGDGAGVWNTDSKWWNGFSDTTWVFGSDAVFGHGGGGGAVTLTAATTVNSLTLNSFTGTYTLGSSGSPITLNNGITNNPGAGLVTIISPVTLGGAQTWLNNSANLLTVGTSAVTNGANLLTIDGSGNTTLSGILGNGAGGLIKNGAGTLTLSGANTYTGATTVNGGTLQITSPYFNVGRTTTIASGATLDLRNSANALTTLFPVSLINGAGTFRLSGNTIVNQSSGGSSGTRITIGMSAGGLIDLQDTAQLINGGWQEFSWTTNQASLNIAAGAKLDIWDANSPVYVDALTGAGTVERGLGGNSPSLTIGVANGSGTFSGSLKSTGGAYPVTKTGTGTQTLSGVNTYTGTTTVSGGTLKLTGGSLGNTAVTLSGTSTFAVQPGSSTTIALGNSSGASSTGGALTLIATSTFDMTDGAVSTFNIVGNATTPPTALTSASGTAWKFDLGNADSDHVVLYKGATAGSGVASLAAGNVTISLATGITSLTPGNYDLIQAASGIGGTWSFASTTGTNLVFGGNVYPLSLSSSATYVRLTVGAGTGTTANKLAFITQPGSALAGVTLPTQPAVQIQDASGTAVALANVAITLSGVPGLTGTVTVLTDSSGKATFSGLSVGTGGNNLQLTASSAGLTAATSTPFNITATGNGTYTQTTSGGNWSAGANWSGNSVAGGAGNTANFNTLDLTADNTVRLDFPVTLGSLIFGDTDTSTAAAWTVDNNGNSANTLTLAGGTPSITVNALGGTKTTTLSAVIAGSVGLTKLGIGTLTLSGANTFTGNITVTGGMLQVSGQQYFNVGRTTTIASGATLDLRNSANLQTGTPFPVSLINGAGTFRLSGTTIVNQSANGGGGTRMTIGLSAGGLIDLQDTAQLVNGGWQELSWTANQASLNIAAGAKFDMWDGNPVYVDALTGAGTFDKGYNANGGSGYFLNVGVAGGSGTFAGLLKNSQSTLNLVKSGAGTQTLSGANTYTGTTAVNAGTLLINGNSSAVNNTVTVTNGAAFGGTGTIGGVVRYQTNSLALFTVGSPMTFTNSVFMTNVTVKVDLGSALTNGVYVLATNTLAAPTVIGGFTFATNSGSLGANGIGVVSVSGNNLILTVIGANGNNTGPALTWATNAGYWDVNVSTNWLNAGTPSTFTNGCNVIFDDTASTSLGILVTNNATVSPSGVTVNLTNKNYTLYNNANPIAGGGTLTLNGPNNGSNVLALENANTYTGGTVVNGATLQVDATGALGTGLLVLNGGALSNSVTSTITNAVNAISAATAVGVAGGQTLTLGGIISNNGGLTKAGAGTLLLANTNTYTGPTTISAGTLTIGGAGRLGGGTYSAAMTNNGAFNYNSSAQQILSGVISGTGSLTNSGSGTLTLAASNTYGGNTTISSGTLLVNGSLAGAVTVLSGGVLGGSGIISGAVTVNNNGTITVGTTNLGTLSLGSTLTLGANATNVLRINRTSGLLTSDQIKMTTAAGSIAFAGKLVVVPNANSEAFQWGDKFTLFAKGAAGNLTGGFVSSNLPPLPAGLFWDTSLLTLDGSIQAVSSTTVAPPVFNPPAGNYVGAQTVAITSESGATIYYTTDGTPPTTSSPVYVAPITVPLGTTMTIKAYAVKTGKTDSAVTSASYMTFSPFPLGANQRATITCLESPVTYDIYLPPGYSLTGTPLPILYTFNPNGGGMVSSFQSVCSSLNIIVVGITGSANNVAWDVIYREYFAVTRDIRQRVLYDPTAEFLAGFSGGGQAAFGCTIARPQLVAGVFSMGGWLGVGNGLPYPSTCRFQTNLLVARTYGTTDPAGPVFTPLDGSQLSLYQAVLHDTTFSGGHQVPPASTLTDALTWLVSQRLTGNSSDQTNALALASNWRQRIAAGNAQSVFRECMSTLMNKPRSWFALQAQLTIDSLTTNFNAFRTLAMDNLAAGDIASDMLYFVANASALNGDRQRYLSYSRALTGITGTSGDRLGDFRTLLLTNGYVAPVLRIGQTNNPPGFMLYITQDTLGLNYQTQWQSNLLSAWYVVRAGLTTNNTGTLWSGRMDKTQLGNLGYFRVQASVADAPASTGYP